MSINPNIALGYQQPHFDNPLDNAGKGLSLQHLMLQNTDLQRTVDTQSKLAQIFRDNPQFADQKTGLPTPEGIKAVYAIDPQTGMKLAQQMQTGQQLGLQINHLGLENTNTQALIDERKKKNLADADLNRTSAFVSANDIAKSKGATDQQAMDFARKAWIAQTLRDRANGIPVPDKEPGTIEEMRPLVTSPKEVTAQIEKKIADDRAMMLPIQKAQAARADLEMQGKRGSREWNDLNDLIKKEKAPTSMTFMQEHPMDPATARLIAEQRVAGDTTATIGLARNPIALAQVQAQIAQIAKERGLNGRDLAAFNAEFMGTKAGERTLGTRTANIEMAVTEAQNVAPLALNASAAVDRTKYPDLNAIILAGEKRTGDPNVVKLGVATNSLINIYSRAIAPSGVPTVSDKDHAREILSSAWSKGQYNAAVGMMMQEMAAARKSPGQVKDAMRSAITGMEKGNQAGAAYGETDPNSGAIVRPGPAAGSNTIKWEDLK